jgi:hypothetical protein
MSTLAHGLLVVLTGLQSGDNKLNWMKLPMVFSSFLYPNGELITHKHSELIGETTGIHKNLREHQLLLLQQDKQMNGWA